MTSATRKRTVDRFPTEWAMDYGDQPAWAAQPAREDENRRGGRSAESPAGATMGRATEASADVLPEETAAAVA